MRVANPIELSQEEFDELTLLSESTNANPRLALRARMVLLAAQGLQNKAIAQELNVGRVQVARWRDRFAELRLAGIQGDATNEVPREMDEVLRIRTSPPEQGAMEGRSRVPFGDSCGVKRWRPGFTMRAIDAAL